MEDLKLLTAEDLGQLLGRSVRRIKMDVSARPETLPPRFIVPGVKSPRWRQEDVRKWMQDIADQMVAANKKRVKPMKGPLGRAGDRFPRDVGAPA